MGIRRAGGRAAVALVLDFINELGGVRLYGFSGHDVHLGQVLAAQLAAVSNLPAFEALLDLDPCDRNV